MQCPQCFGQMLKIEVQFRGFVTARFHDAGTFELTQPVSLTSRWDDDSPCRCETCAWEGVVASCQLAMTEAE